MALALRGKRDGIIVERGGQCSALTAATRFLAGWNGAIPVSAGANAGPGVFYFDPADWSGSRARLRVLALVNAVAPVSDFTVGMYPVTAMGGAAATVNVTVGAVIAASQVAVTAPAANSQTHGEADFDLPAAGFYIMGVITSATGAASSSVELIATLEAR